jgi:hypothetical protein
VHIRPLVDLTSGMDFVHEAQTFVLIRKGHRSAMMVPREKAALASWVTGWFNLLGQVAITTGIRSVHIRALVVS